MQDNTRFDKEALLWDTKPRRIELATRVANYAKDHITPQSTVLDFGCGSGLVSFGLCDTQAQILGVDLSCEMVKVYNHKARHCPQARAICTDISNITQTFDIIIANMVFHHIADIHATLSTLSSKLVDGGKLFICDLAKEDGSFHDHGNDGVFHLGFDQDSFTHPHFHLTAHQPIYTIHKHKPFDVYIWHLTHHPKPS
ncbi:MAG: class I SAM-dependent methyltransferase [Epsilonproteobacteria bacterium]|nr:class I SAM-dependent methyltransferase [Campylobacterota bacterium]